MFGILEKGQGLEEEEEQRKEATPGKVVEPIQQQITTTQHHESWLIIRHDIGKESLQSKDGEHQIVIQDSSGQLVLFDERNKLCIGKRPMNPSDREAEVAQKTYTVNIKPVKMDSRMAVQSNMNPRDANALFS